MKKNIAVVATSAAIGKEKGLNRMYYLAELLEKNGYCVDFITSDFQHWSKSYRNVKKVKSYESKCNIVLLHETGYKKNIDPRRIYSHFILARNINRYLELHKYNLVYCDMPDNHVAVVCARYAKRHKIPFIVDVEDLWPKAMYMVFNVPVLSRLIFSYFAKDAKTVYKICNGVVGSSDTYRDDSLNYGIEVEQKATVYVGNDLTLFDKGVKKYESTVKKVDGEYWVTYAGTLGTSYDIKTMIQAAGILKKRNIGDVKIILLGDGPLREVLEKEARESGGNVCFLGYLSFEKMAAYLSKSDIVVNSVKKNAPQSIVSKIGDYLASGVPMINTCIDSEFWEKVETDGFGINVRPENAVKLAEAILYLRDRPEKCKEMGKKARKVAVEEFDRQKAFMKIVNMIGGLVEP